MDVLVLSSLARIPMHGYELKLELRYKHVHWWAKCEHGHLYATLTRLERLGHIAPVAERGKGTGGRHKRVYRMTPSGGRELKQALEAVALAEDASYFDIDLFLAGASLLTHDRAISLLERRVDVLRAQLAEARKVMHAMGPYVPAVGKLVMHHRVSHLEREVSFAAEAAEALRAEARWEPFLGQQRITDFVKKTGVPLESQSASSERAARGKGRAGPRRGKRGQVAGQPDRSAG